MKYLLFKARFNGIIWENKGLKLVLLIQMLVIFVLAIQTFQKKNIITLIPPSLNEQVDIAKNKASSAYLSSLALYFSQLMGNVTPGNVNLIQSALSPMLSPTIYQHVMDVLHMQTQQIKNDNVTLSFQPRQTEHDIDTGKLYVTGYSVASGISGESSRELRTYEFEIKIENFSPVLVWMTTYQGQPRK